MIYLRQLRFNFSPNPVVTGAIVATVIVIASTSVAGIGTVNRDSGALARAHYERVEANRQMSEGRWNFRGENNARTRAYTRTRIQQS